jgi:tRNA pseudouridine55 synthase
MVSALKVGGERLYRMARRGETVERRPRPIEIHAWEWLEFALPEACFKVTCSSGTYVRTLAHDLGGRLGVGATLMRLRRLASEPFDLTRAVTVADLDGLEPEAAIARAGIVLEEALAVLPRLELDEAGVEAIGHGRSVPLPAGEGTGAPPAPGRTIACFAPDGVALALGEVAADARPDHPALVRPRVVFPWAVREGGR